MEPNDDRELSRLLREWEAPESPPELESRLIARRDRRWRMRFGTAMALAAAAAVVLLLAPLPPRRAAPAAVLAGEQDFVPAPNVLPLDSYEIGRVLRVDLPVAALLSAGYSLPAADPAATVRADVLVGEDGRVHAVRLVSGRNSQGTGD